MITPGMKTEFTNHEDMYNKTILIVSSVFNFKQYVDAEYSVRSTEFQTLADSLLDYVQHNKIAKSIYSSEISELFNKAVSHGVLVMTSVYVLSMVFHHEYSPKITCFKTFPYAAVLEDVLTVSNVTDEDSTYAHSLAEHIFNLLYKENNE